VTAFSFRFSDRWKSLTKVTDDPATLDVLEQRDHELEQHLEQLGPHLIFLAWSNNEALTTTPGTIVPLTWYRVIGSFTHTLNHGHLYKFEVNSLSLYQTVAGELCAVRMLANSDWISDTRAVLIPPLPNTLGTTDNGDGYTFTWYVRCDRSNYDLFTIYPGSYFFEVGIEGMDRFGQTTDMGAAPQVGSTFAMWDLGMFAAPTFL
jgi:hypothetical protein